MPLPSTIDTLVGVMTPILKSDPTSTPLNIAANIARLKGVFLNDQHVAKPAPELITRKMAAALLCRTPRAVDLLAAQGYLTKIRLPGRVRAAGFLRSEVENLLTGGQV